MVFRHLPGATCFRKNGARIASVGTDHLRARNQNYGRCAAREAFAGVVVASIRRLQLHESSLAGGCLHELVHLDKALLKGLLVALALETLQFDQLFFEILFDVQCNFLA